VLERERRWAIPVALATFAGLGLLVASILIVRSVAGGGEAEVLRSVEEHRSDVIAAGVLQALGLALIAMPLVYLFRAAQARSERVRGQLIGLVVAAPLFLASGALLNSVATNQAASDFAAGEASADLTAGEATADCRSERRDDAEGFREDHGRGEAALRSCAGEAVADDAAASAVADAPLRGLAIGLGFGGSIGLAFALGYSALWAMRVGLLTRFWGSLGIALGVAVLLQLTQFTMFWFLYFALLAAGWLPGGRPPAWAAGEAIPWPSPGEKAADKLSEAEDEDVADSGEPRA